MSTSKRCPICGPAGVLDTNHSLGQIYCTECGTIVEEGILVSEVGFAEGSSGRMHVSGAFIGNGQTGFANVRGSSRGGVQNFDNIKQTGAVKIDNVARQLHINNVICNKAKRFYSMAVDNKFNKGRRTEYIVASCLYLACRLNKDAHMLIDFSERLSINVYELGATYLKLRSILHLPEQMPEVDPAIYNLRFAHKLDFGTVVNTVAVDASRLVRRFKADWMVQGRRPAGVCGACLIIAARMSNFLRTPDEVAQVVKVHPTTIKKRLLEFAQTEMAKKTVAEWRSLTDAELDKINENERPPIVKQNERKQLKVEQLKAKELTESQSESGSQIDPEGVEEPTQEDEDEDEEGRPSKRLKGKGKSTEDEMTGVVAAAAHDVEDGLNQDEDEEEEDDNMEPISQAEYVRELESARDNPEESRAERLREKSAFMKEIKNLRKNGNDPEDIINESDLEDLLEEYEEDENDEKHDHDDDDDKEEDELGEPATQLRAITREEEEAQAKAQAQGRGGGSGDKEEFTEWENTEAVLNYMSKELFKSDELLYQGKNMTDRIKMWIGARDPKILMDELSVVQRARIAREKLSKVKESDFGDLDDEELEYCFKLDEDEKQARARMWLSSNGKWLEEEKVRIEQRAIALRAKGIDPTKNKPKRKRAAPHKGPYNTPREAIQNFTRGKQFSSRINYDVLRNLPGNEGLMPMNDDKDDYDDEEGDWDDEKGDDEKGDERW